MGVIFLPILFVQETHSYFKCSPKPQGEDCSLGREKKSQERLRPLCLASNAHWLLIEPLPTYHHSYNCSSDQKTKSPQKFSHTQGKYFESWPFSVIFPVGAVWLLSLSIWAITWVGILCHVTWYINPVVEFLLFEPFHDYIKSGSLVIEVCQQQSTPMQGKGPAGSKNSPSAIKSSKAG